MNSLLVGKVIDKYGETDLDTIINELKDSFSLVEIAKMLQQLIDLDIVNKTNGKYTTMDTFKTFIKKNKFLTLEILNFDIEQIKDRLTNLEKRR